MNLGFSLRVSDYMRIYAIMLVVTFQQTNKLTSFRINAHSAGMSAIIVATIPLRLLKAHILAGSKGGHSIAVSSTDRDGDHSPHMRL